MLEYQKRVVEEKTELDEKIEKLQVFLSNDMYKTLPRTVGELLVVQLAYMQNYSDILSQRIVLFNVT